MANSRIISTQRIWLARGLAVAADVVQVGLLPVSVEGAMSPVADGIDLVMTVVLTLLIGWHIAFIPSIFIKLMPVADLAPTWTIAVFVATRGRTGLPETKDPSTLPDLENTSPKNRLSSWFLIVALCVAGLIVWLLSNKLRAPTVPPSRIAISADTASPSTAPLP